MWRQMAGEGWCACMRRRTPASASSPRSCTATLHASLQVARCGMSKHSAASTQAFPHQTPLPLTRPAHAKHGRTHLQDVVGQVEERHAPLARVPPKLLCPYVDHRLCVLDIKEAPFRGALDRLLAAVQAGQPRHEAVPVDSDAARHTDGFWVPPPRARWAAGGRTQAPSLGPAALPRCLREGAARSPAGGWCPCETPGAETLMYDDLKRSGARPPAGRYGELCLSSDRAFLPALVAELKVTAKARPPQQQQCLPGRCLLAAPPTPPPPLAS